MGAPAHAQAPRGEFNPATNKTESPSGEAAYDRRFPGSNVLNPGGFGRDELQSIEQLIANNQKANTNAEVQPYQQKAQEIKGIEGTVSNRFGQAAQQTQGLLLGILGQAEGSAKTAENQAAETTLQAQKAVETAGQNAITSNGGYLDPQLRAALQAGQAQTSGIGAAGQARASEMGQAQTGYVNDLRAAAAARATEGQRDIANRYQGMQQKNTEAENNVIARSQARGKELGITIPKELLTSKLAVGKLEQSGEIAKAKIGQKGEEIGVKRADLGLKGKALEGTERQRRESNAINRQKLGFDEWAKREDLNIRKLSAVDKARYDQARVKLDQEKAQGKAPNPKEGRGYMQKLSTAVGTAKRWNLSTRKGQQEARAGLAAGTTTGKGGEAGAQLSQDVINAALNLAVYGRLSTVDQAVAQSYGLTPQMRPEWFRSR